MKIIYLDTSIEYGGGQASLRALVDAMIRRGDDVLVFTPPEGELRERLDRDQVPVQTWRLRSHRRWGGRESFSSYSAILKSSTGLAKSIREYRPDIVHANTARAALAAVLATWLSRRPAIIFHDRTLEERRGLDRWIGRRCDSVFAISCAVAKKHEHRRGHVCVLPDGIDLDRFTPLPPRNRRPVVFAYLGRRSWEKGPHLFAKAAERVHSRKVDARFVMTLDCPSAVEAACDAEVDGAIRRAAEQGAVDCVGFQADIAKYLEDVDVVVLPSLREGLGIAAIEALARGRPVIASRVGGLPEIVRSGESGMLVEPGDVKALADVIFSIAAEPGRLRSFAEEAPRTVSDYSWERMAEQARAEYCRIL